jgi:hypothetical protein
MTRGLSIKFRPVMAIVSYIELLQSPFFFNSWSGTFGTAATTGLLYQPRMIGDGDCGEISGMKIGRGNRSTRRKPAPAPLCPSPFFLSAILPYTGRCLHVGSFLCRYVVYVMPLCYITYGAEPFFRSCQLRSYSRTS